MFVPTIFKPACVDSEVHGKYEQNWPLPFSGKINSILLIFQTN